jgi:hypothetical protein
MSLTEQAMDARRWDAYPELRTFLKEKSIDEKWLPRSSIEHTLMDRVNDANEIFQLIDSNIESLSSAACESDSKSNLNNSRNSIGLDLHNFEQHLMWVADTFYSRATSIRNLNEKLRANTCLDSMPDGTNLKHDLRNSDEISHLFKIINFLCGSVAWYHVQYGRYEETPIEELLTFYGLKLTEDISEIDSNEFAIMLGRRIREYLSKRAV